MGQGVSAQAESKMKKLQSKFRKTGILMGVVSGLTYGIYSPLVGVAGAKDPFLSASAKNTLMSALAVALVTCGLNDLFAGIWLLISNAKNGKLAEIPRSLNTFPGKIIVIASVLGGPIANGAYLLGISTAGASAIPISATCALFGALFAWIFLKQKPTIRIVFGMLICVAGAVIINLVKPEGASNFTLGIICAFIAAICWGLEGTISSFGGAILDCDVAVNIRELVSGLSILIVVVPIIRATGLLGKAIVSPSPMMWLVLSGLSASAAYLTWYKANSMVGCAIGMSLNVTYAFWGVALSVLFLGTKLTPTMAIGCLVIIIGAITVTMNPLDFLKKGEQ